MQSDFDRKGTPSGSPAGSSPGSSPSQCSSGSAYHAVPGQEDAQPTSAHGPSQYANDYRASEYEASADEMDFACERNAPMSSGQAIASVIGGAGVGALLMYLLDPEKGPQRRHEVGSMASGAWESLRDKAGEYGSAAYDGAGRLKDRVAHSGFGEEAYDRARYLARGNQRSGIDSGLGQFFAGLGVLAAGAAAMYYMDPQHGAQRRNECSQKTLSAFNRTFSKLDGLGKDLWNRTQGLAHEAKSHATREQVDDRVLTERIRSEIGRCVANAGAIDVAATDGTVIVSGYVQRGEHDPLLKCIWGVRGVNQLINRLDVREADQFRAAATTPNVSTSGLTCPPALGSTSVPNPT